MRSWPAPHVPDVPGRGTAPRVFDRSTGELRPTAPGPVATLYVCGITPYDATHLGHAATYVAFDLLVRAWLDAGHEVRYVQNITDVDDPLLERALVTGQDWTELAQREIELFREDMTALAVVPPAEYIGAVEAIPLVAAAVDRLVAAGAAYEVDGDVYFAVHSDPRFGAVANLDEDAMRTTFAERGGDPDRPGKKHPLDCLLWQAEREGEPAWDPSPGSTLRRGRPGWHIECTSIALEHLGTPFDVQGGGSDLAFPHHEMGASEAHVLTGSWPYARTYLHTGMVGLDGEKMSKSRGNLVFVSSLRRDGVDPMAIRLALLDHHYRGDWAWTADDLERANTRLAAWRAAVARDTGHDAEPVVAAVRAALSDDLDAPRALRAVDQWAEQQRLAPGRDPAAPGLVAAAVDAILGVRL